MEIAKLVLEYIRVLEWPIFAMAIALLFRNQLGEILGKRRKADLPGGVSLDFNQEIKEAKTLSQQVVRQIETTPVPESRRLMPGVPLAEANARMLSVGLQPSPSGLDMSYYRTLASQDPNLALAGLRIEIDVLARNLARGFGVSVDARDSGARLIRKLRDAASITTEQMELTLKVLKLCNVAIHGRPVSREEAEEVIDVASVLTDQYLRWLSWGFDDGLETTNVAPREIGFVS